MYHECKLIHADFSEYNLLWFNGTVYVIDVAQSVEPYHTNAYTYLLRDCTNVSTYFSRLSLNENVLSPEEIFNFVTDLTFEKRGKEFLDEVQTYEKNIRLQSEAIKEKDGFSFDYFFDRTKQNKDDDDDDDSSSDDDDEDDVNYVDMTSEDEFASIKLLSTSAPSKKLSPRKKRLSEH